MTEVDWTAYRKCEVCGAPLAKPCASMTGTRLLTRDRPHTGRKLRTGR